jgi:hypothetical protein
MSSSPHKMHDEKIEHDGREELAGEFADEHSPLTKQVLWKMDIRLVCSVRFMMKSDNNRILPILALLFLCSFIDRTNVGNAKILGLQADTHMTDHQYAIGLCAFYATYIARFVHSFLAYGWS